MTTSIDKLNELFNTAKTYWVCPVTGVRFDASDSAAISAHKDKVISNAIATQKAKALKDGIRDYKVQVQSSDSIEKLQSELSGFVCFLTGEVVDFKVQIRRNKLQGTYRGFLAVTILDYKNLSAEVKQALQQGFNLAKEGNNYVVLVDIGNNSYFKDAYYWQNTRLDKREKALAHNLYLAKFDDVVAKKEELKSIIRELHVLRAKHGEVLKQYNALKESKLADFDDIYRK